MKINRQPGETPKAEPGAKNPDISKLIRASREKMPDPKESWVPKVEAEKILRVNEVRDKYNLTGKGVGVAVIGSGFEYPGYTLKAWKDFAYGTKKPTDLSGHETHCVGDVLNMAPEADIIGIRVEEAPNNNVLAKAVDWATKNKDKYGIKVINLSCGEIRRGRPLNSPPYIGLEPDPIDGAIARAHRAGISVIAASGNEGRDPYTIGAIGDAPEAITVGSTVDDKILRSNSSCGPVLTGSEKPDVVAPGEFIVSLNCPRSKQYDQMRKNWQQGSKIFPSLTDREDMRDWAREADEIRGMNDKQLREFLENDPRERELDGLDYTFRWQPAQMLAQKVKTQQYKASLVAGEGFLVGSGTSFSCPEVAGIAALLYQAKPDLKPDQLKAALKETARDLGYQRSEQGAGMVDALSAVERVLKNR